MVNTLEIAARLLPFFVRSFFFVFIFASFSSEGKHVHLKRWMAKRETSRSPYVGAGEFSPDVCGSLNEPTQTNLTNTDEAAHAQQLAPSIHSYTCLSLQLDLIVVARNSHSIRKLDTKKLSFAGSRISSQHLTFFPLAGLNRFPRTVKWIVFRRVGKQEKERKKKEAQQKKRNLSALLQLTVITQVWKWTIKLLIKKHYLTAKSLILSRLGV
jgi:hypothetical protein